MTRRERRLVEALVGGRTAWVDGVALAAAGSALRWKLATAQTGKPPVQVKVTGKTPRPVAGRGS